MEDKENQTQCERKVFTMKKRKCEVEYCGKYFLVDETSKQRLCVDCRYKNPIPIRLDFKQIRSQRQKTSNIEIMNNIKNGDNIDEYINKNELERVLEETGLTKEELLYECEKNDLLANILAGRISKKTSRQGTKDEYLQMETCNKITSKYGIHIEKLNVKSYRATKCGVIIDEIEIKKGNIKKDNCLKSFDGKIEGEMKGWIFAKVVYGNGGHQDNVFEEADILCDWVKKYNTTDTFVLLIDTDLDKKLKILKDKYNDVKKLLIMNHYEFQEYVITNYSHNYIQTTCGNDNNK